MLDTLSSIGGAIMAPLYFVTSAILVGWHWLFAQALGEDSGWSWVLSIIGLTLTIRAALIPLFVKQIKASRNMQLVQPRVKELQKKYGHDRERLAQETMKLYQETGTNPFASCMPLLLQMPIFISLFRLVDRAAKDGGSYEKFFLTSELSDSLSRAKFFGARIAETFLDGATGVKILAAVLVIAMTATTFLTQRQLMRKNMPADALTGQYAQQQKMLLYILPLAFGFGGIFFPIGVLLYWTTSNLWTMTQQFYVIRNNPVPGTPAFKAKQERDAKHGKQVTADPLEVAKAEAAANAEATRPLSRQQPKKQSRSQRASKPPATIDGQTADASRTSTTATPPGDGSSPGGPSPVGATAARPHTVKAKPRAKPKSKPRDRR